MVLNKNEKLIVYLKFRVCKSTKSCALCRPVLHLQTNSNEYKRIDFVDMAIGCLHHGARNRAHHSDEIPHRLLSTRSTSTRLLTPRQREVFEVASREGYWDVPRRINLTELAGLLNVAKSTLSNQLQRIESAVFHAFTEEIRRQSG